MVDKKTDFDKHIYKIFIPFVTFEKTISMKIFHFCMASLLMLAACSTNKTASKQGADPAPTAENKTLEGTYWVLTELNGRPVASPKEGEKPSYIYFDASKKRASVSGGCNVMGGSYELMDGNRLKFGNMMSTMMACPDMTNEDGLKAMTGTVDNYAIQGDNLMFAKARMAPMARFKAATPPAGFKMD
jgi:heat shock protein HslJ